MFPLLGGVEGAARLWLSSATYVHNNKNMMMITMMFEGNDDDLDTTILWVYRMVKHGILEECRNSINGGKM